MSGYSDAYMTTFKSIIYTESTAIDAGNHITPTPSSTVASHPSVISTFSILFIFQTLSSSSVDSIIEWLINGYDASVIFHIDYVKRVTVEFDSFGKSIKYASINSTVIWEHIKKYVKVVAYPPT